MTKRGKLVGGTVCLCLLLFYYLGFEISAAGLWDEDVPWDMVFTHHGLILILADAESGQIIKANQLAASFFGYSQEQLSSMGTAELYAPLEEAGMLTAAEKAHRETFIALEGKDGSERTLQVHSSYIAEGDGLIFYVITDITEKEVMRRQLQKSADRLGRMEEIAHIGSWEFLLAEDRVLLSPGAQRILGWDSAEQTMQDTYDNTLPEYRQIREEALRGLIEEGRPYNVIFKLRRASDGAIIDVHSIAHYDRAANRVFGTFHDISEFVARTEEYEGLKKRHTYLLVGLAVVQLGVIIALVINIRRRQKAEDEILHNLERNESLVRILQYPAASIQELIDYALQESINLTDSQIGYIYFYDEKKKQFTLNTWSKEVMPQCTIQDKQTVYQLDKTGIWGEAVRQRKPLIVNDFNKEHPLKKGYPEGHVPLQKYMTVPIFDGEEIVAVIGLANKKEDYDEMDIWQITLLMNSVWSMVERQRSKIALRDEKERLSATLLSVGDAVIATDKLGRVEIMNEVAEKLTEWDREDAVGQPFSKVFKIVNEQTGLKCPDPVEIVLASGKTVGLANHTVLLGRRGGKRHIADAATPIRDAKGEISGVVLVFRDVSQERKRLEEIRYLSNRDHLTGLYNRRYFEQKLAELDTAESLPISIIMADLDGLKIANDTFGHSLGDQILRRAAEIMKRNCRSGDIVARWGGDEFVLLLPHTNIKEAEALGLRVEGAFKNERVESVPLSISLGWAVKTDVNQEMGEIFKKAEDHMFRAKLLQSPGIRSDVIQALMTALYEKDPREEQHCQRVSKYSQLLGRTMGLNERKVRELGVTGLFHDIGKVSIPEQILNKPGRLTEEEWKEIRRHPEVGYRVLSNVKDMAEIADYVLAHHERWDGQGYPRGLQGLEIPLQARIIAVADAYDAMISYRPYKKSLSEEEALEELVRCAGTQFDPEVVEAFVQVIKGKKEGDMAKGS